MNILSFDVTSNNISIAITKNRDILFEENLESISTQSELLTLRIENSLNITNLNYHDLDLVAFINGPASFTSVRIGFIVAKAINLCCNTRLFPISSNMAIASKYLDSNHNIIITAIDACLDEVYFQILRLKNNQLLEEETEILLVKIDEIEQYLPKNDKFLLIGSAKEKISKLIKNRNFEISLKEDMIKAKDISNFALSNINNKFTQDIIYIRNPKIY